MAQENEIEIRCKVKKPKEFRATLRGIDSAPIFSGEVGEVVERNLVFECPDHPGSIFRLRERAFPSGRQEYIRTIKGPNKSSVVREKSEENHTLSQTDFLKTLSDYNDDLDTQYKLTFVYERVFRAEHYRRYRGVEIELFQFPYLGWWCEFELKRGTLQDLERVTKLFGFTLKDNDQASVKDLSRKLCRKEGLKRGNPIPWSSVLVFDEARWRRLCADRSIAPGVAIRIPGRPGILQ